MLQQKDQKVGLKISGGVSLTALAMQIQGGDARALQELVVRMRPTTNTLSWGFEIEREGGQLHGRSSSCGDW